MYYHSNERRDEVWTDVSGFERVVLDGVGRQVSAGDVIEMAAGVKYAVFASVCFRFWASDC